MIDCFISPLNKNPYHCSLTEKALNLSGFLPILIKAPSLFRYFECEKQAQTDVYIFSEDNVLPITRNTVKELLEVFERYPDYGILGLNEQGTEYRSNKEVLERESVKGLQVIRKGILKDLGYVDDEDTEAIARTFKRLGYKVGITRNLYSINL
jgi:hypothetical protein